MYKIHKVFNEFVISIVKNAKLNFFSLTSHREGPVWGAGGKDEVVLQGGLQHIEQAGSILWASWKVSPAQGGYEGAIVSKKSLIHGKKASREYKCCSPETTIIMFQNFCFVSTKMSLIVKIIYPKI